ncbi:MAG: AMP-binding protein [Candidatus Dormibacteraeota bacterium]|nr:AMP-binding protein [Candidatus Dormibacteraeota bacterium]
MPLLATAWETGAAVLPIDERLPGTAASQLIERAHATVVIAADRTQRLADPAEHDEDLLAVVATSGSTGEPRLVELTRDAVAAAVTASAEMLGSAAADPWLLCLPPAHIGGMLVLWRHIILGAPVELRAFSVDAMAGATDARFASLVPTQLRRLLDAGIDLSRFRAILVGGAGVPSDLASAAAAHGVSVVTTYGLTESCGGVVYSGRTLPGTSVRIANGGEVQIAGPTLMRGYRSDPAATAAAFTDDGWLRTRDAGAIGSDGVLTVHGRLDDAILSGGETVWPLAVEAALASHPQVADVGVTGWDDDEWGQRVVAFVVPRDAAAAPTLAALREHVARRLPRYMAPRELLITDMLPRTTHDGQGGKVRRDVLRRATGGRSHGAHWPPERPGSA